MHEHVGMPSDDFEKYKRISWGSNTLRFLNAEWQLRNELCWCVLLSSFKKKDDVTSQDLSSFHIIFPMLHVTKSEHVTMMTKMHHIENPDIIKLVRFIDTECCMQGRMRAPYCDKLKDRSVCINSPLKFYCVCNCEGFKIELRPVSDVEKEKYLKENWPLMNEPRESDPNFLMNVFSACSIRKPMVTPPLSSDTNPLVSLINLDDGDNIIGLAGPADPPPLPPPVVIPPPMPVHPERVVPFANIIMNIETGLAAITELASMENKMRDIKFLEKPIDPSNDFTDMKELNNRWLAVKGLFTSYAEFCIEVPHWEPSDDFSNLDTAPTSISREIEDKVIDFFNKRCGIIDLCTKTKVVMKFWDGVKPWPILVYKDFKCFKNSTLPLVLYTKKGDRGRPSPYTYAGKVHRNVLPPINSVISEGESTLRRSSFFSRHLRHDHDEDPLNVVSGYKKLQRVQASELWLRSKRALRFTQETFCPLNDTALGMLNNFVGLRFSPSECQTYKNYERDSINVNVVLDHIYNILCRKDRLVYQYLINWCAHLVQYPSKKLLTVPYLVGEQGIGKSLCLSALGSMFGPHFLETASVEDIAGKFTATLDDKIFVLVNEADNMSSDVMRIMKALITDHDRRVEKKYSDVRYSPNYINIIACSNMVHSQIMNVPPDERRFMFMHCDGSVRGKHEYLKKLYEFFDCDYSTNPKCTFNGCKAFMWYLMDVNISQFNPRKFPVTKYMVELKLATCSSTQEWLYECLCYGRLMDGRHYLNDITPGTQIAVWELNKEFLVLKEEVFNAFFLWTKNKNKKIVTAEFFWNNIREVLTSMREILGNEVHPVLKIKRTYIEMPRLNHARLQFSRHYTGVQFADWHPAGSDGDMDVEMANQLQRSLFDDNGQPQNGLIDGGEDVESIVRNFDRHPC